MKKLMIALYLSVLGCAEEPEETNEGIDEIVAFDDQPHLSTPAGAVFSKATTLDGKFYWCSATVLGPRALVTTAACVGNKNTNREGFMVVDSWSVKGWFTGTMKAYRIELSVCRVMDQLAVCQFDKEVPKHVPFSIAASAPAVGTGIKAYTNGRQNEIDKLPKRCTGEGYIRTGKYTKVTSSTSVKLFACDDDNGGSVTHKGKVFGIVGDTIATKGNQSIIPIHAKSNNYQPLKDLIDLANKGELGSLE